MRTQDGIYEINIQIGQTGQNTETEEIEKDENIRILDGHLFLYWRNTFEIHFLPRFLIVTKPWILNTVIVFNRVRDI